MNIKKIIVLSLLILPIVEIVLFVEIGSIIGSFNTILIIFVSALTGIYIIKYNAAIYMSEIRTKLMNGLRPDQEILSGLIIFICGVFLLIPGFLTDLLGLFFLFKPARLYFIQSKVSTPKRHRNSSKGRIIDVDHTEDK